MMALASAPVLPYIQRDRCPGEFCHYGAWSAVVRTPIYAGEGDESKITFWLAPGERFNASRGDIYVTKAGTVQLLKRFRSFEPGDTLYLLGYRGEGCFSFFERGRERDQDFVSLEFPPKALDGDRLIGRVMSYPEFTWWVAIEASNHRAGWLALHSRVGPGEAGFDIPIEQAPVGRTFPSWRVGRLR